MIEKTINYIGIILALAAYTIMLLLMYSFFNDTYQPTYKHNICIDVLSLEGTNKDTGEHFRVINAEAVCDKYSKINEK